MACGPGFRLLATVMCLFVTAATARRSLLSEQAGYKPQPPQPELDMGVREPQAHSSPLDGDALTSTPAAEPAAEPSAGPKQWPANVVLPGRGRVFQGDGTAFSEPVNNTGQSFACSFRRLNDWASYHFAAINHPQWEEGNSCGRCATVRCIDKRCTVRDKDVTVMIVDQCPECNHGDLDFAIPVYKDITGLWPHRLRVQWQWAECASLINGTIQSWLKEGSNPYWQAFFFSGMKYPLKSVRLNGRELVRSQFQFFQHYGGLGSGPHKFELEAQNGMRVTAFSEDPLKDQDLGVQFPDLSVGDSTSPAAEGLLAPSPSVYESPYLMDDYLMEPSYPAVYSPAPASEATGLLYGQAPEAEKVEGAAPQAIAEAGSWSSAPPSGPEGEVSEVDLRGEGRVVVAFDSRQPGPGGN